jgi:hypothetical protein
MMEKYANLSRYIFAESRIKGQPKFSFPFHGNK